MNIKHAIRGIFIYSAEFGANGYSRVKGANLR